MAEIGGSQHNPFSDAMCLEYDPDQRTMDKVVEDDHVIQSMADLSRKTVSDDEPSQEHQGGVVDDIVVPTDGATALPSMEHSENLPGKQYNNLISDPLCLATPGRSDEAGHGPGSVLPYQDPTQEPVYTSEEKSAKKEEDILAHPPPTATSTPVQRDGGLQSRPCVHKEGGVCTIHGPGAKLRWRPSCKTVQGEGKKKKYERVYWYECDLMPGGRGGRVRQLRLSFGKTTPKRKTTPVRRQEDNIDDADQTTPTVGKTDAV